MKQTYNMTPRGGAYTAPSIDLLNITVEQGFAGSIVLDYGDEGLPGTDPGDINGGDY